jgi:hypothetical protein
MAEQLAFIPDPPPTPPAPEAPKPPRYTEPIPLTSPDGRVFTYACCRCLQIPGGGHHLCKTQPTPEILKHRREEADQCCRCATCKRPKRPGLFGECKRCSDKRHEAERPQREAWQAAQETEATAWAFMMRAALERWDAGASDPYPLTITHGRDGYAYFAFALARDEVPSDIGERMDCMTWVDTHDRSLYGYGETPEAALADLRAKALVIQRERETT